MTCQLCHNYLPIPNSVLSKMNKQFQYLVVLLGILTFTVGCPSYAKSKQAKPLDSIAKTKQETKSEKKELIDLNSASKEDLMKIAGIGSQYSEAIIKGRPYKAKNQLTSRKILPEALYKQIADQVIAKQK